MLKCQYAATSPSSSSSTMPAFATYPRPISPRERYLWDIEEESAEILADAYSKLHLSVNSSLGTLQPSRYDDRGRQTNFRETVRQRQERLEFVRRQEFTRRLALKGLSTPAASAYVVRRLPPARRPNAGQRAIAAIKIQRTFRARLEKRRELESSTISSISSSFSSLRSYSVSSGSPPHSPKSKSKSKSSSPSQPRRTVSIREYEDRLTTLFSELEHVMTSIHPSVRPSGERLFNDLKKEFEDLEEIKSDMWMKQLCAVHNRARSPTRGEVLKSSPPLSPPPSPRRSPRQSISRRPSLDAIEEE